MSDKAQTLVLACGAIAHELVAIVRLNAFNHVKIQCLPASWHNTPQHIAPGVEKKLVELKDQYSRIVVAYGDCGTGGQLDDVLARHNVERLPGDHCYSFFAGKEIFNNMADAELGTFYLTDYLVDHFDKLILEGLGINKHPQLRDMYFAHYTRVMYLSQHQDQSQPAATHDERVQKAQAAADALGLPLEIHITGLKPFEHALRTIDIAVA